MFRTIAGAALALSLTFGASAAMAADPITTPYTDDFGRSQIAKVAGLDFSDTYSWDFGVTGSLDSALISLSSRSTVTFTSILWNGIEQLTGGPVSAKDGVEFAGLAVNQGVNTLKVSGEATGTGPYGAYAGTIDFAPAPAPLAAGLPLLLGAGFVALRSRRRAMQPA